LVNAESKSNVGCDGGFLSGINGWDVFICLDCIGNNPYIELRIMELERKKQNGSSVCFFALPGNNHFPGVYAFFPLLIGKAVPE
jgi:hypothetical protein